VGATGGCREQESCRNHCALTILTLHSYFTAKGESSIRQQSVSAVNMDEASWHFPCTPTSRIPFLLEYLRTVSL